MTMGSEQYLDDLLVAILKESGAEDPRLPRDIESRRLTLRAYMNVRHPMPIPDGMLRLQDAYLKDRNAERGVFRADDIPTVDTALGCRLPSADRMSLWQGDITTLDCDAIVNAANSQMLGCFSPNHKCIDNCIHTYAGMQLRLECHRRMTELRNVFGKGYEQPTSVPMLTGAYNLPCRHVIHVVGPIAIPFKTPQHERDLAQCYRNVLDMCRDNGIRSVAFCCISTGVFGFPNDRAAEIAVGTVSEWLDDDDSVDKVIFNVFLDKDRALYEEVFTRE